MTPTLYIIAGCNGAGRTTASYSVLPDLLECREFVNADEIAKGLSPFNPESVAIEAGKLMLQRINLLLSQRKTFAIETTLHRRYWLGLQNFFNIFVYIVDSWSFYNNVNSPVELANETETLNNTVFNKIRESCLNRKN